MNQEELIRQEIAKQLAAQNEAPEQEIDVRPHTYPLAGGAIGGGLGFLAANPMDAILENRKVSRSTNSSLHREALIVLDQIHRGVLHWEDIEDPGTRQALQEMYKGNIELLKNPEAVKQMIGDRNKGSIVNLRGIAEEGGDRFADIRNNLKSRRIAQFMPETRPLAAVRKFNHPAVAAGSLVGMLGGSVLANHLAQKNNTEN